MGKEVCQRCGDEDYDRRTLWMACLYAMDELGLPFEQVSLSDSGRPARFFTLRVCKDCRADWMAAIKLWFEEMPRIKTGCGSGIFVRENGALVELTEEEWYRRNPGRDPVRVKE